MRKGVKQTITYTDIKPSSGLVSYHIFYSLSFTRYMMYLFLTYCN